MLKNTEMQISYSFNMIAIVGRRPRQVGVLPILDAFINHRKEVVTRRTTFDLEHAKERYHILEGLILASDNIDEVISIIRASSSDEEAENKLYQISDENFNKEITLKAGEFEYKIKLSQIEAKYEIDNAIESFTADMLMSRNPKSLRYSFTNSSTCSKADIFSAEPFQ